VKVNCAALPTELLESELFGFEKGAFTGAIQHKPGKFEFANHGTMFLDEIGDMSFPLQAKLLQALQDGEFSRLGGKSDVRVDVRVITATNCDLEGAVAAGKFREDLYFRLNVVTITVPTLRERREEIPMLTDHFVKKYSVQYNKPFPGISADLARMFMEYDWPGNVRQLENLIKRMVVLGSEGPIVHELRQPATALHQWSNTTSLTPRPVAPPPQPVMPPPAAAAIPAPMAAVGAPAPVGIDSVATVAESARASSGNGNGNVSLKDISRSAAREAERELILRMLTKTRWNRKEAAEILGISYKALLYKIKENGLDKAS
jgi:two-component system, NtrC family, response regulator AtoC